MSEHQMEHTDHGKYADEFRCPVCGRTVIWVWTECPTMIVVKAGDKDATHTGATGGLQIGGVGVEAEQDKPREAMSLELWELLHRTELESL